MNRLSILAMLVATIALFGWLGRSLAERNTVPSVTVVGGTVFDAGQVSAGKRVVHAFVIVNPHPFPVGLSAPTPGCSCTTATASSTVIPARGRATVTLKVDQEDGNIAGSASIVTTHAQKSSETDLLVSGTVKHG